MSKTATPQYITSGEVIERAPFPISYMFLHRLRKSGFGPDWTTVGKWTLYDSASVDAWIDGLTK